MVTRCIHAAQGMCRGCQEKAVMQEDDRYWLWDEKNNDWVYNPIRPSINRVHYSGGPVSNGMPVSAGGSGGTGECKIITYDPSTAEQQTVGGFRQAGDISKAEADELRRQLTTALLDNVHAHAIARTAMDAERHIRQQYTQQIQKFQAFDSSKEEVEKMTEKRIGDADRNRYIEHLGNMFADGHLNENEFSERSDKANAAKTMSDLRPLVADLPDMPVTANYQPFTSAAEIAKAHSRKPLKTWLVQTPTPVFLLVTGGFFAVLFLLTMLLL